MTLRMNPAGFQLGVSGCNSPLLLVAANHQHMLPRDRQAEADLPLAEAVFAFILAELRFLPALAAIAAELDPRDARITAERNAAGERRDAGPQRIRWLRAASGRLIVLADEHAQLDEVLVATMVPMSPKHAPAHAHCSDDRRLYDLGGVAFEAAAGLGPWICLEAYPPHSGERFGRSASSLKSLVTPASTSGRARSLISGRTMTGKRNIARLRAVAGIPIRSSQKS
jgi:hypothetical protein